MLLKSDVEKPADSLGETSCPGVIHSGFPQAVEKKQVKKSDILWGRGKNRTFWGIYTGRTGVLRNYPHPCLKGFAMGNSFPHPCWKSPNAPYPGRSREKRAGNFQKYLDKACRMCYTFLYANSCTGAISSVGQSSRLITGRSKVRVLDGPAARAAPRHGISAAVWGSDPTMIRFDGKWCWVTYIIMKEWCFGRSFFVFSGIGGIRAVDNTYCKGMCRMDKGVFQPYVLKEYVTY